MAGRYVGGDRITAGYGGFFVGGVTTSGTDQVVVFQDSTGTSITEFSSASYISLAVQALAFAQDVIVTIQQKTHPDIGWTDLLAATTVTFIPGPSTPPPTMIFDDNIRGSLFRFLVKQGGTPGGTLTISFIVK